ncbi:MAG: metallophosphoesterase [Candidatus Eisenbacteria bacterium]
MNIRSFLQFAAVAAALVAACGTGLARGASAVTITDESQLLGGPAAQGRVGDLLLSNDHVAFVIEAAGHANGDALSGGHVLDAAPAVDLSDRLDHLVLAVVDWPRQAVYATVAIESDGTAGDAIVRAEGVDSADPNVGIVTRYILSSSARAVEMETVLTNNGASQVDGYRAGDAIDWSYGDNFVPGHSFEVAGLVTFSEWIGCHDLTTSYAYAKPSGTVQAEHGNLWSDSWLWSGSLAPSASTTLLRYLAVGTPGLSSASDVVLEIQGVNTGNLTGVVSDLLDQTVIAQASVGCSVNGIAPYTTCVTGTAGVYSASLPPVNFELTARAAGYFEATENAAVAQGGTTRVDIALSPSDYAGGRGDTLTVIMRPILTVPAIVIDGESFVVEAVASPMSSSWEARLRRGESEYALSVSAATYDAGRERWFLDARVPSGVPEEMYDLILEASGDVADTAAHSVAVRDTIPSDFYFIHITDTHLPNHTFYGNPAWEADTTEMNDMRAVIDDINLANPAFVLLTGDVVNEGEAEDFMGKRAFTKTQRILKTLDVPVFAVAGNHDVGGWDSMPPPEGTSRREWWRFFGWRYLAAPPAGEHIYTQNYSFNYGDAHFVGLESYVNYDGWRLGTFGWTSFTDLQMQWLLDDLAAADPSALKVLFYHYDFDDQLDLQTLGVDGSLWGHIHTSSGSIHARPFDLATDNVCDGERSMRLVRVTDGVLYPSEHVEAGTSVDRMRVSFDAPNDGTQYRLTATVVNSNIEHYDDALVRFHVRADSLPYRTSVGEITQTLVDGDVATCYAHFGILSQNTATISIEPTGETPGLPDGALALMRQSYPNPARTGTTISFVLASRAETSLKVFDVAGRLVRTLHDGPADPVENVVAWDLRDDGGEEVASGIYFCRLETGGQAVARKLVVLK